ncbi:MAG: T9SS type A sorting domain-containing protein [Bacteroidetes bacterium]|nr:T9SS type A sorting domain-containing protein [Bacteroidota bacterium]
MKNAAILFCILFSVHYSLLATGPCSTTPPAPTMTLVGGACSGGDSIVLTIPSGVKTIQWYCGQAGSPSILVSTSFQNFSIKTIAGYQTPDWGIAGLWMDADKTLYTSNNYNNCVRRYPQDSVFTSSSTIIAGAGTLSLPGNPNMLSGPKGICRDSRGYTYVADNINYRIQRFPPHSTRDSNAVTVAGKNTSGLSALNLLNHPEDVALDSAGFIYVADRMNNRVIRFPPNSGADTNGVIVAGGYSAGSSLSLLNQPTGVFIDRGGNLFVSDYNNNRIIKFPQGSLVNTAGTIVAGGNGAGTALNQFIGVSDVWLDSAGYIYGSDIGNSRILRFPPGSTSATMGEVVAGGDGMGSGQTKMFLFDTQLCTDNSGHVYVADSGQVREWSTRQTSFNVFRPTSTGYYTATYTTDSGCVSAYPLIPVDVTASVTPSVTISASRTILCPASTDTFRATAVAGGTAPVYQWYKNGQPVGANSSQYISSTLSDNDSIWVSMTSNATCATTSVAVSTHINLTVIAAMQISGEVSGLGSRPDIGTIAVNVSGGPTPYTYDWGSGITTKDRDSLVPGSYALRVTDSAGCVSTKGFNLIGISGRVHTWSSGAGVDGTSINAGSDTMLTDSTGAYNRLLLRNTADTIMAAKDNDSIYGNGITLADEILVQRHAVGTYLITNPYALIAADVDVSASVTMSDAQMVEDLLMGNINSFGNGKAWSYVPSSFVFSNPASPWAFPRGSFYGATGTTASIGAQDFIGVKIGDVSGDWNPLIGKTTFLSDTTSLYMDDISTASGSDISIPVRANNFDNISGLQFALSWDTAKLAFVGLDTLSGTVRVRYSSSSGGVGYIKGIWTDPGYRWTSVQDSAVLFYIKYHVLGQDGDSAVIKWDESKLSLQVLDSMVSTKAAANKDGTVRIAEPSGISDLVGSSALMIYPNPTSGLVTIYTNQVSLQQPYRIYDMTGRLLIEGDVQGKETKISLSAYPSGIYTLHLAGQAFKLIKE